MKNNRSKVLLSVLSIIILAFTACEPEEFTLGELISKDALDYSIIQDAEDPNMVILISKTPGMTPMWVHPMGRSTRMNDTVRLPFAGNYEFVYGVQSPGGFVQADTFHLEITTDNLSYVDDPLWTLLTGGVGHEKVWLLDLNAEGVSKYFSGPVFFSGNDLGWNYDCLVEEGECWRWEADWPGNQWIGDAGDYGTMTFRLIDGAFVIADHKMIPEKGLQQGTFFLDAENKMLSMTDAAPLQNSWAPGDIGNFPGNMRLISLTENTMQIGAFHLEKEELMIFNYISKDYSDNWVPADLPDPEPELEDGWMDDVSKVVSTTITWKLSIQNPLDWATLDGTRMNGWNSPEEYPDWLGTPDPSVYSGFSFTMDSQTGEIIYNAPDGTQEEGTYTLEENGVYTFFGIDPSFPLVGWANFNLTAENQLRILSVEKTGGIVTGMWVGAKDPEKPEYMAYHLVPVAGDGPDPVEIARAAIITALTGDGSRTFKLDDTWPVDWGTTNFTGGWTSTETFADYTSNTWLWTEDVYNSIQEPRITFSLDNGTVTVTLIQDGTSTSAEVLIDAEKSLLTIETGLISFGAEGEWLPVDNTEWKIIRTNLSDIPGGGIWFATVIPKDDDTESIMYRYVVAD